MAGGQGRPVTPGRDGRPSVKHEDGRATVHATTLTLRCTPFEQGARGGGGPAADEVRRFSIVQKTQRILPATISRAAGPSIYVCQRAALAGFRGLNSARAQLRTSSIDAIIEASLHAMRPLADREKYGNNMELGRDHQLPQEVSLNQTLPILRN